MNPILMLALNRFCPRAISLQRLELRNLTLNLSHCQSLASALVNCQCLTELSFSNMPLHDDGGASIMMNLAQVPLTKLTLASCDLTDQCGSAVKALLGRCSTLRRLDLKDNSFTSRILLDLEEVLGSSSLIVLNLRGNRMVDSQLAANINHVLRGLRVLVDKDRRKSDHRKPRRLAPKKQAGPKRS